MSKDSMFEDIIREHGWAVQGVSNPPGMRGPSGWAYTIGLEDHDRPEMLIVGMPTATAHSLLNRVITDAVDGARPWPSVGDTIVGLAQGGYGLRVVAVHQIVATTGEWFLGALARRGGAMEFRPLQLVWQYADYSWPSEHSEEQPVLGPQWW